jgi:hypothetical protein
LYKPEKSKSSKEKTVLNKVSSVNHEKSSISDLKESNTKKYEYGENPLKALLINVLPFKLNKWFKFFKNS